MMRHVHSLRMHVVSMLLQVVNALVRIGGKEPAEDKPQAQAAGNAQPMETDQDEESATSKAKAAGPRPSGTVHLSKKHLAICQGFNVWK